MWIITRIVIAIVFLVLLQFYFSKKTQRTFNQLFPKAPQKFFKYLIKIFLLWLNLYPLILITSLIYSVVTKQSPLFPDNILLDYLVIYPFWILFILTFQLAVYFLLFDLMKLLLFPIYRKYKEKFLRYESILILFLSVFFVFYIPARIIYDYNAVEITEINYNKDVPAELRGFRLVFISDIQADKYTDTKRLKNFIDKVNQLNPDLVLIAGDVITSTPEYIETAAKYIGMIKSRYGVYSCVGDHDNWAYRQDTQRSVKEVTSALEKYHVEMIDNDVKRIKVDSTVLGITFITNTYVEKIPEDVLTKITNSNHADFKILLTHQPQENLIKAAANNGYNLFLAGHTHGGQLTLLFPFIQITPTLVETTFIRGLRYYNNMLAVVTRGLGMSLAPVRYNSTPEIVRINFQ